MENEDKLFKLFSQHTRENREDFKKLFSLNEHLHEQFHKLREDILQENSKFELTRQMTELNSDEIKSIKSILELIKHNNDSIKIKMEKLEKALVTVNNKVAKIRREQDKIFEETELSRFAQKYPNTFKLTMIGVLVSVLLACGSAYILYKNVEEKNKTTQTTPPKTESTK
jgi:hypothetical protein